MSTSALDLLIALDGRLDDLETTTMLPGSIPRVRQEWRALARVSLQLLQARPRHPNDSARRLEAILNSLAAAPGEYPLPAPGTGLMDITATIGCTAEVMRVRTVASPAAREQAGDAIRTSLEAALARAARWTQRGFLDAGVAPETEIVRLAGSDTDPHRSSALQTWRLIGPTDPGITAPSPVGRVQRPKRSPTPASSPNSRSNSLRRTSRWFASASCSVHTGWARGRLVVGRRVRCGRGGDCVVGNGCLVASTPHPEVFVIVQPPRRRRS